MAKPNIVFVNNYIWSVDNPDVRMKYEMLSERYQGLMFYLCSERHEDVFGNFRCISSLYGTSLTRALTYPFFCLRMVKKLGYVDAIVVYDPLLPGLVGCLLKLLTKAPLIVEVNTHNAVAMKMKEGSFCARLKHSAVPLVTGFVLRCADAVKFVSAALRADVTARMGLAQKRVSNFSDFVPTTIFSRTAPAADRFILTVGYPYHIKGVDVLIRAFNLISGDFPTVKLKVIGSCSDLSPYRDLAAGNGAIEFHQGMPYAELIPYFERCLLFVLASRTEGLPRVLIEAMAAGKPIVASNVGGVPELVEDGVNGFLFENGDHEMLARKMKSLLSDEQMVQEMGERSYQKVQESYSPRRYMDLYHDLISQAVALSRGGAPNSHNSHEQSPCLKRSE